MGDSDSTARADLRAAWDDLMAELGRARDAIDRPECMPAPATDRNLAEGYRYLLGFAHSAIERAFFDDPAFPTFRHAIQIVNKATIDNADAIYFLASIDGRSQYRVRGELGDHRHWRGEQASKTGRKAPQYVIFELSDGCMAGDSGSLAELRPGVKVQTGRLDSSAIRVETDGHFEILLGPERPAGFEGNFISSCKRGARPHPDEPDAPVDRYATYVSGRQLFYDWQHEEPVRLSISRIGADAEHPAALDPGSAAQRLRRMGALVQGQMQFWNEFYTVLLETYGKRPGATGERFMPRNAFNAPNAAAAATGGGQSTNIYAGGVYELEPDEALVIHAHTRVEPQYIGFHLSNLWGESHDFAHHQSSLNGFQADREPDGSIYWVVAHRDPGVANWVDTTGHREGFMAPRWAYSQTPPPSDWPRIEATKVRFDEIRRHLPAGVRPVGARERAEQLRIRREHVQRRYRAF